MLHGTLPSVMGSSHAFSRAPQADIPRSRFDRSHGFKTTFDAGYLVPEFAEAYENGKLLFFYSKKSD